MKTFMPWIALMPAQAHEVRRVAGFLYGWLQREHQLNLRAYDRWWTGTPAAEGAARSLERGARALPAHGEAHRRRRTGAATAPINAPASSRGAPRPNGTARLRRAAWRP